MAAPVTARDPRVAHAVALLRAPADELALDGPELVETALAEGLAPRLVLAADPARWAHAGTAVLQAGPDALRALGALGQPAEVVAIVPRPAAGDPARATLVLAGVRDAGNVGSILRTAAALGRPPSPGGTEPGPTVAVRAGCADPFSRRALRAAAGASLRAGLVAPVAGLQDVPGSLAAAVPRGGVAPAELPPATRVVLGSERDGLAPADLARCALRVTVPAPGFESLNVAAAAAILLWEASRR